MRCCSSNPHNTKEIEMTNEEFIKYVTAHIRDYLPADFKDAEVRTDTIVRPNDEKYTGLALLSPGRTVGPRIPLEEYAEMQRSGRSLDDIMVDIAETIATSKLPMISAGADLGDFGSIRESLTTKLCDPENSRDYLTDKPWTPVGEWGLLYRVKLLAGDGIVGSAPITNEMLAAWDMDVETLHREAVASESGRDPAWMCSIMDVTMGGAPSDSNLLDSSQRLNPSPHELYVLSNRSHFNGACVVGWEGVLDRVGELLGDDFAVIPTSIHEVLIAPNAPGRRPEHLEEPLHRGNADPLLIARGDILSNKLQFYNCRTHTLGRAEQTSFGR